jgi:hypothetical protein
MKQSLTDNPPSDDLAGFPCVSLLSALVDLLEITAGNKKLLEEAKTLCEELAVADPVRRKYWRKREQDVMKHLDILI